MFSAVDDDGMSPRQRICDLLAGSDSSKHLKLIVETCLRNTSHAGDILDGMVEQFGSAPMAVKKGTVHLLNALLLGSDEVWSEMCSHTIRLHFASLTSSFLESGKSLSMAEIFLQWIDRLDLRIEDGVVVERLKAIIAASSKDQEEARRRKRIQEQMEKDRETHKELRERCWSRPEGETDEAEFLGYYRVIGLPSKTDLDLMFRDQRHFLQLNGRRPEGEAKRPKKTPAQVFVFDIQDSFVYLDCFLDKQLNPPPDLYQAAARLDNLIAAIADRLFFYRDFKAYPKATITAYRSFDDGKDLARHNFATDRLSERDPRRDDPEFGREWAYRARHMVFFFSDENAWKRSFPADFLDSLEDAYHRLDGLGKRLNSLAHSIFALLSKRPDTSIYLVAPRSLSYLFALCLAFQLNGLFGPDQVYSTAKAPLSWCLEDIKARHPGADLHLFSGHDHIGAEGSRRGFDFMKVLSRQHMLAMAQKFELL